MRLPLGIALSFLGPITLGWLLVRRLWPSGPLRFRFSVGMPLGMGVVGGVYYLALLLTRSAGVSLAISEACMIAGITVGAVSDRVLFHKVRTSSTPREKHAVGDRAHRYAFLIIASLAAITLLFTATTSPYGQWDATAVWNLKARFIYESPSDPIPRIMDPALWDTQPDYPLLLPILVARGWQYAGPDSVIVPIAIAILFTVSTVLVLVDGVRTITNPLQSYVTGCVLLATPFFVQHGVSQYADLTISCFMTISVVFLCIGDAPSLLAGLAAGLAACTKNEGLLFVLVFMAIHIMFRRSVRETGRAIAGVAFGVTALGLFKVLYSPPNPIVNSITTQMIWQRLSAADYHVRILKAFAHKSPSFGDWWIAPFLLLILHIIATTRKSARTPWPTAALAVAGMLGGYYAVYLLSPYDLDWHIGTSMNRLLLQLWPMLLLVYSLLAAGPPALTRSHGTLPHEVRVNG